MNKISIIIPNYNGKKLLEKNLPQVVLATERYKKNHKKQVEIVIVDDCSDDASVDFIQKMKNEQYRQIEIMLIQNKKNVGFSSTVNKGVNAAKGDIVVLLNTDVLPDRDFLLPLITHFTDDTVFAVGCMDKSVEADGIVLRGRGVGSWQRGFLIHSRGEINSSNTLWASGGSSAFRKAIWVKLGGLYETYNPFYWEDIDISYRALKAGYQVLFEKESVVEHAHESGIIRTKYSSYQIKTIAYRNQCFFVWINVSDRSVISQHLLWLPYHIVRTIINGDFAFVNGLLQAIVNFPKVLPYRKKAQLIVVKSDTDIVLSSNQ